MSHNPRVNNITAITADDKTKTFDYDAIDRLIKYDLNITEHQEFTYNENGNRLSKKEDADTTYTYKDKTNILESVTSTDTTTYTYDETGNIIDDGIHTYTYDGRNRLVKVDDNVTYTYNYDNKRTSKTVAGATTYYIYDAHKLVGEYDENGRLIKEYIYNNNTPIAIIAVGEVYKVFADHLDTSRRVADSSDTIVWEWKSKPFGESEANGTITMNLRFPGQYFDSETGTHYNINRDYNPVTGRYIQSDPIGFDGGVNTYGYVGGNSIALVDLEGLKPGDKFRTREEAVRDAYSYINPASVREGREYAGWIHRNMDGTYSYNEPIPGTKDESDAGEPNMNDTDLYHTHGSYDPDYYNEKFSGSDGDKGVADFYNRPIYVATPLGKMKKYDPRTKTVTYIGPVPNM